MNNSRQPLARLKSSESGARPKVTPRAQPAAQLDDEFRAFFDRGDVGDYEGGVAHSQRPVTFEPIAPDESRVIRTSEQRARRALFTKVVTFVVVGCASLLVVAMGFKSRSEREEAKNRALSYDVRPSVAQAAMIAPVVQQIPVQRASENLQNLAPPPAPAPPDLPEPATEANSDTATFPQLAVDPQVPSEPPKDVAAPVEERTTVKKSSPVATVVQTKRNPARSTSNESRSAARARKGSATKVAARTDLRPAPKARPSVAAFPVD